MDHVRVTTKEHKVKNYSLKTPRQTYHIKGLGLGFQGYWTSLPGVLVFGMDRLFAFSDL